MSTKGERDNDDTEIPGELPLSLSPKPSLIARKGWLFPWVMCIFLSAALIVVKSGHRHAHHQSSYETGFDTDLGMLASEKTEMLADQRRSSTCESYSESY
jgi:hypothetical protein